MAMLLRLTLATLTFLVFFYSTTLANELFLSAGLGTNRILAPIGKFLNAGCGQGRNTRKPTNSRQSQP